MKSVKYAAALVCLGLASQAQATRYAYCTVQSGKAGDLFVYHQSGIIEIAEEPDAVFNLKYGPFGQGFLKYIQSTINPKTPHVDCDASDSLKDAIDRSNYTITGGIAKKTGWLGGRPAAVERDQPKRIDKDALILTMPGQKAQVDTRERTNSTAAKQQWEIDYEVKMAKYQEDLARQQQAVAEYQRAQAEMERTRAEQAARATKARAEHERLVARCKAEGRCAVSKQ